MKNVIAVDFGKRCVVEFGSLAIKMLPPEPIDWYEQVKEKLIARFGENQPRLLRVAMARDWIAPYRFGCFHDISYKGAKRHAAIRRSEWNRPHPFPTRVKDDVSLLGENVELGADPLPWVDIKYQTCLNHIRARNGRELVIRTRSDLIAEDKYVEAIDKINHRIEIILTVGVSNEVVRQFEPGAPSNKRRIEAFDKLKNLGYRVSLIRFDASRLVSL